MPASTSLLDAPYALTDDQKTQFHKQGFIHLPGVFDRATLEAFDAEITRLTLEHNPQGCGPFSPICKSKCRNPTGQLGFSDN